MNTTTVTFRTDEKLKEQASELFDSLGMNLSTSLNMFMKQAVLKQKYPCSLELGLVKEARATYPAGFFELFGSGNDFGFDSEPDDLQLDKEIVYRCI